MLTIGVFVLLFAEFGIKLFIREEAAVDFGRRYLRVVAFVTRSWALTLS